jgi:hypothetical protein
VTTAERGVDSGAPPGPSRKVTIMTQQAWRPLTKAEEALVRSMVEGMVRQARRDHPELDFAALTLLVGDEVTQLPEDHLVQRYFSDQFVRDEVERELQEEVETYLQEQVANGRYERHPADPDRYRLAMPAGTPWE